MAVTEAADFGGFREIVCRMDFGTADLLAV